MEIGKFEWNRQLFHIFLGVVIVALLVYDFIDKKIISIIIIAGLILSYLSKKIEIPIINKCYKYLSARKISRNFPAKGLSFIL